jgi:hypothetical protein
VRRLTTALLAAALAAGAPAPAAAEPAPMAESSRPRGRPDVELDRLEFPTDVAGAHYFKQRLRKILKREARRADWGAGRGARIQYRFTVTELVLENDGEVLRVRCTAVGKLPKGKSARSNLRFGGPPNQRNKVVERVLEIVARGVITRLAELERIRRGDLPKSRVRPPRTD